MTGVSDEGVVGYLLMLSLDSSEIKKGCRSNLFKSLKQAGFKRCFVDAQPPCHQTRWY
jgi:hypothetical protein